MHKRKPIFRLAALCLTLVLTLGLLAGCVGDVSAGHITVNGKRIAIDYAVKFDDYAVSMAEYRYYFLNLKNNYFDYGDDSYWEEYPEDEATLLEYTLNYLRSQYAAQALAESYGISLDANDRLAIANQIQSSIDSVGSEADFVETLSQQYMSEDCYTLLLTQSALQQKLNDYLFGENGTMAIAAEDEVQTIRDNYIHTIHLQISDQAKAEEALSHINAGASIADLLDDYNEDTQEDSKGYVVLKNQMGDNYRTVAEALSEGQISGLIEANGGYFIIQRLPLTDEYISANQEDLISDYKSELLYELMDEKASTFEVKYNKYYDQFGVNTILNDGLDTVYGEGDTASTLIALIGIGALIAYLIVLLVYTVLILVSLCFIFKKAGERPWAAIVPFYNSYCLFRMTWGNGWMFLTTLIPIANIVISIMTLHKLSKAFGHDAGWTCGLIFLPVVFMPMLAFGKSAYAGANSAADAPVPPEGEILPEDIAAGDAVASPSPYADLSGDYGTWEPEETAAQPEAISEAGEAGETDTPAESSDAADTDAEDYGTWEPEENPSAADTADTADTSDTSGADDTADTEGKA